jgi:hypothetical protein
MTTVNMTFSRAWVTIGISLRYALAAGLHLKNEDPHARQDRKEYLVRTWWSLHSIETLLCAIIGRPCVIPNDECTVPLPQLLPDEESDDASLSRSKAARHGGMTSVAGSNHSSLDSGGNPGSPGTSTFLIARITINIIMQKALSKLYSARTASGSWERVQRDIASLTEELKNWASSTPLEEIPSETPAIDSVVQREQLLLAFHYHSTRLLISRPCLCRLERRIKGQSNTSAAFNNKTAEVCVQAAQAITRLLPDQPDTTFVYHTGPWWCIVHNIMQAMAVFLLEISYGEAHMKRHDEEITKSTKKLVRWLQHMRGSNAVAERAYSVAIDIIKTGAPRVTVDISDILEEEHSHLDRSQKLRRPSQSSSRVVFRRIQKRDSHQMTWLWHFQANHLDKWNLSSYFSMKIFDIPCWTRICSSCLLLATPLSRTLISQTSFKSQASTILYHPWNKCASRRKKFTTRLFNPGGIHEIHYVSSLALPTAPKLHLRLLILGKWSGSYGPSKDVRKFTSFVPTHKLSLKALRRKPSVALHISRRLISGLFEY